MIMVPFNSPEKKIDRYRLTRTEKQKARSFSWVLYGDSCLRRFLSWAALWTHTGLKRNHLSSHDVTGDYPKSESFKPEEAEVWKGAWRRLLLT